MQSLRILGKNWKLAAIAVFSLAMAMALCVVSLSLGNTFLLLPPAGASPDQLVMIYERSDTQAIDHLSYPDYLYLRDHNNVFTGIAALPNSIVVGLDEYDGRQIRFNSRPVPESYFAVLGLRPYLGRLFGPGDDRGQTVAVMTYACWRRLGSDPNIIGKKVGGNIIVGVAPKEFTGSMYGLNGDLLTSFGPEAATTWMTKRDERDVTLLARLKPGISRRQAQNELTVLSNQLAEAYPKEDKNRVAVVTRATLVPPDAIPDLEISAAILLALVSLVLLIACANVANLLLAVAVGRRQEAAIKLALGAQRHRLILEFMKESAFICGVGGVLGFTLARLVAARFSDVSITIPMLGTYSIGLNLHFDVTVITATAALMLVAMLATGLAPALYASNPHISAVLSGEIVVGGTRKNMRRNALAVVQIAVCTLVLVVLGLCVRSVYNLRRADPGFSSRNLVAEQVMPKGEGYKETEGKQKYVELHHAVSAVPGVESVSLASDLPLLSDNEVPAQLPDDGRKVHIAHTVVDDDYFATLGIGVLAGRIFNYSDREKTPEVIVINRKMAEMFFSGRDPLGRTVTVDEPPRNATIVGVVADGKYGGLDEEPRPFLYYALNQHYQEEVEVIARTKGDPRLWVDQIANAVNGAGFKAPVRPVTYDGWMNLTILPERITAGCVAALSALALILAVVGLFGAISYSVSERKKELGIRVALGATRRQLIRMVLRQTCFTASVGIAVGAVLGIVVTVLLRSQLFGIAPFEWAVLFPVSAGMLAVSLAVAYISAKPWLNVDPMEAVRHA